MVGTLTVNSFLGIDRAEINITDGITLLAGKNSQGKSSLIESLRCLLMAETMPLNLLKKDVAEVIHHGAGSAEASLATRSGTRKLTLPKCEISLSNGSKGLNASAIATASVKYTDMDNKQRAQLLIDRLGAKVTDRRLREELETTGLTPADIKAVAETAVGTAQLPGKGFEAAEKLCQANALSAKREFLSVTGKEWNTKQGFDFLPAGWEPDLEKAEEKDLEAAIVAAREAREQAIASNAISEDKMIELMLFVETKADNEEKLAQFEKTVSECKAELEPLQEELLNAKVAQQTLVCPCCDVYLVLSSGKLVEAAIAPTTVDTVALGSEVARITARLDNAQRAVGLHKNNLDKIVTTEKRIKELEGKTGDGSATQEADKVLARAAERLKAFQAKQQGLKIHERVKSHLAGKEVCAPDGLQKRLLMLALDDFNQDLAALSAMAGWNLISVDQDLVARYGGRNYRVVSKSEKYRVDATLVVALAKREKAPVIIFDDSDVLVDRELRTGFFKLLLGVGIPAVVGMAIATRNGVIEEKVPDLAAAGKGITYWVEDGAVTVLKGAVAA